jgi:hypothetical protein
MCFLPCAAPASVHNKTKRAVAKDQRDENGLISFHLKPFEEYSPLYPKKGEVWKDSGLL